jgi:coenzyme Q-binding protein COQ10
VPSQKSERSLPYDPVTLFDLAADVEQYPQFLSGWQAAQVYKREGNVWYVEQLLGVGPVRVRFHSRAVMHRPERIDVSSDDSRFRRFRLSWRFEPDAKAGCRVQLSVELELRSRLLQGVVDRVMAGTAADILAAFERRAHQIYTPSHSPL